jgi:hypothetical protein
MTGNIITGHNDEGSVNSGLKRFRSLFGTTPLICSLIWCKLVEDAPANSEPRHLLYALLFLKVYGTEAEYKSLTNCDEKTFRKWSWIFIDLISQLNVVSVKYVLNLF